MIEISRGKLDRVVIVGRPNVGKSTLFNRLAGRRRALTHDLPGMTRDRLSEIAKLDDGRTYELIDTGGLEYGDDPQSAFAREIRDQAMVALEDADLILFVVNGVDGVVSEDHDIAQELRPVSDKVIVILNKMDTKAAQANDAEFYQLGFERILPISAEHGTNIDDVFDAISEVVKAADDGGAESEADAPVRLAIIGRPNVGKSSLLNRLTSQDRAVVSDIAGTTRDAIDAQLTRDDRKYLIIDTAGIRRKGKTTDEAEKLAVMSARKAIERCEIVLLVIDGTEGITAQDATVAGYAEEAGRAALILVNKWDIVETTPTHAKVFEEEVRRKLKFLAYAPLEFISAKTGRRVEKLFPTIEKIAASFRSRFRTSELNEILARAVQAHQPPAVRGRPRRFYYATQLRDSPPTIAIFSNIDEPIHFSYKRFLDNRFREELGLVGTPVHLVVRGRKGMKSSRKPT